MNAMRVGELWCCEVNMSPGVDNETEVTRNRDSGIFIRSGSQSVSEPPMRLGIFGLQHLISSKKTLAREKLGSSKYKSSPESPQHSPGSYLEPHRTTHFYNGPHDLLPVRLTLIVFSLPSNLLSSSLTWPALTATANPLAADATRSMSLAVVFIP